SNSKEVMFIPCVYPDIVKGKKGQWMDGWMDRERNGWMDGWGVKDEKERGWDGWGRPRNSRLFYPLHLKCADQTTVWFKADKFLPWIIGGCGLPWAKPPFLYRAKQAIGFTLLRTKLPSRTFHVNHAKNSVVPNEM
ncbi:hypothetical protein BJ684DRAFT_17381, partial [Piptocephalis cylindrospora]